MLKASYTPIRSLSDPKYYSHFTISKFKNGTFQLLNYDEGDVDMGGGVYWIVRGQHSPVDYFNKYPGRFTVLHIKDDKEIGDSGMVGFDAIFRNAKVAGVKHIVAEIEGYSCPVEESVKKSLDYLLDAPFVKASYSK